MQAVDRKDYMEKLLSFCVGANARSDAEKIHTAFVSSADIASTSAHVMQNLSGCSEQAADFIRLVASLSSRRVTDNIKNGKKYSSEEIERYVCALLFHLDVESVYMISFDKTEN